MKAIGQLRQPQVSLPASPSRASRAAHRLGEFLRRWNSLPAQLLVLAALNLFAGWLLCGSFLAGDAVPHDNLNLYSIFRDQWNSLNYYGEILWWNPRVQLGFPLYYFSILGVNGATPLYTLASIPVWLLGRIGVHPDSFYSYYIFYFGFLTPFALSLGMLLLARQIFRSSRVIFFILVLTAFSPSVLFNITDLDPTEQTVYGLYFAAALLNFFRRRSFNAFLLLGLSVLVLSAAVNHLFLYWNALFVPIFFLIAVAFQRRGLRYQLSSFRAVHWSNWVLLAVLCLICLLPTAVAFSQGGDIVRSTTGTRTYDFSYLRPGNPLEILGAGTPAVGWDWVGDLGSATRFLIPFPYPTDQGWIGYGYSGLVVLPFTILGLIAGRRSWRMRMFILLGIFCLIVPLSAYSSFFAPALAADTPLRAVNHYSDSTFREGGCLLLILSAGLGLDVLLRHRRRALTLATVLFLVCSAAALGLFAAVYKAQTINYPIFGFSILMIIFTAVVLGWITRGRRARERQFAFVLLILLVLLDTSTLAHWFMRTRILANPAAMLPDPPAAEIGTPPDARSLYAQTTLQLRSISQWVRSGHGAIDLPYLLLLDDDRHALAGPGTEIRIVHASYNSVVVNVTAPQACQLLWRSSPFPFWTANVESPSGASEVAITTDAMVGLCKVVPVQAGRSTVRFAFSPGLLPASLFVSYFVMLLAFGYTMLAFLSPRFRPLARNTEAITSRI